MFALRVTETINNPFHRRCALFRGVAFPRRRPSVRLVENRGEARSRPCTNRAELIIVAERIGALDR